ncbi:MAG: hypothetical protein ACREVG_18875 [Burkholderiales bacterium]
MSLARRRGRPRTGKPASPAERMRRYRAQRRAAGLRPVIAWAPRHPLWSDHRIAEARSLALHVLAVRRIVQEPALLDRARATVRRWLERYGERPPAAVTEWKRLLQRPWPEIAARASALTEEGARLRQSSPLATLLGAPARRRVHDAFRS